MRLKVWGKDSYRLRMERKPKKEAALLDALRDGETLASAAAKLGICYTVFWEMRKAEPDFAEAVSAAQEQGRKKRAQELEAVLHRGANKAVDDPRYTTQLIFALKNMAPDRFRDVHDYRHSGSFEVRGGDKQTLARLDAIVGEAGGGQEPEADSEAAETGLGGG